MSKVVFPILLVIVGVFSSVGRVAVVALAVFIIVSFLGCKRPVGRSEKRQKIGLISRLKNSVNLHNDLTELSAFSGFGFYGRIRKIRLCFVHNDIALLWSDWERTFR